jgi:hypothetical protein
MYPFVAPTPWAHKAGDSNQYYHYNRRSNCHVQHLDPWTESQHHLQRTVSLNVMQQVVFVFQEGVKLFASPQILLNLDSNS